MNASRIFSFFFASSLLALTACGSSTNGGTGGGGTGGTGGGDPLLCKGVPSGENCESAGCPSGYACVKDADPNTCHSSTCSCDATGWVCTADCGMNGSSCVVTAAATLCNGVPSSENCEAAGCPDGWTCTKDPDTTTCHSSSCSCDATGWVCTDDCGMGGSSCVKGL